MLILQMSLQEKRELILAFGLREQELEQRLSLFETAPDRSEYAVEIEQTRKDLWVARSILSAARATKQQNE